MYTYIYIHTHTGGHLDVALAGEGLAPLRGARAAPRMLPPATKVSYERGTPVYIDFRKALRAT